MARLTKRDNSNQFHLDTARNAGSRCPLHPWTYEHCTCMAFCEGNQKRLNDYSKNLTSTAPSLAGRQLNPIIRGVHRSPSIHWAVELGTTLTTPKSPTDTGVPSCTPESRPYSPPSSAT
ncbi:hypothetical protein BDV10DRAFT_159524 [Aspergillus recurvatus]